MNQPSGAGSSDTRWPSAVLEPVGSGIPYAAVEEGESHTGRTCHAGQDTCEEDGPDEVAEGGSPSRPVWMGCLGSLGVGDPMLTPNGQLRMRSARCQGKGRGRGR